jgi:hypothetical protein
MAQLCKAAMAARVGRGHLLDNFEDSRWLSSLSLGFAEFLWLNGCDGRRRQRQFIDKHLGQRASWTGLETGQADRPMPGSAPFHSPMLLGQLLTCSLMHVGPWRRLPHGLDGAPCCASFSIFRSGPWSFVPSHCGPWVIWSHVHLECWLVPGLMIFSQSAHWTSPRSAPFSA